MKLVLGLFHNLIENTDRKFDWPQIRRRSRRTYQVMRPIGQIITQVKFGFVAAGRGSRYLIVGYVVELKQTSPTSSSWNMGGVEHICNHKGFYYSNARLVISNVWHNNNRGLISSFLLLFQGELGGKV